MGWGEMVFVAMRNFVNRGFFGRRCFWLGGGQVVIMAVVAARALGCRLGRLFGAGAEYYLVILSETILIEREVFDCDSRESHRTDYGSRFGWALSR